MEQGDSVFKLKPTVERIAIVAVLSWLGLVSFLTFKNTALLWDDLRALVWAYRDFHLWHSYSAKAATSIGMAFWIAWVTLKCGAQLIDKILPSADLPPLEKRVFSAGLGFAAISFVTFFLGLLRLWYVSVFWCVLISATIVYLPRKPLRLNWHSSVPTITPLKEWWAKAAFGLLLFGGLILLLGDLAPEIFYDSLHYHLAIPNLYLLNHRIDSQPNFAYASLVMIVHMFWGFALTVGNEITVKLLHGATALLLFFAFIAFERRYLSRNAGLLATLFFVSMPIVGIDATTAGIDVASSAFQFLAVFAVARALSDEHEENVSRQWIGLAGLLTGVAATCKFTCLPTIPIGCIVIAWRRRRQRQNWPAVFKQLAVFLIYAAVVMFPFYMTNVAFHHNPVYPIGGTFWGEPRVSIENWQNITTATLPPQLSGLSSILQLAVRFVRDPWFITIYGRDASQDFIGPVLLGLLPLLLIFRPRSIPCSVLAGYSIGLWVAWLFTTTVHLRFGMPLLAILSLLLAHALLSVRAASIPRHAVLGLCVLGAGWNLYYTFLFNGFKDGWRVVGGIVSEADYLAAPHYTYPRPDYEGLEWMNHNLPAGSKVMMVGDARSYYTSVPVVPASIFDTQPIIQVARNAQSGADMARLLRQKGVTHLFVNEGEAIRTESYRIFPWNPKTWVVLDDFWHAYVRLIWSSASGAPNGRALYVYQIRSDLTPPDLASLAPPNPFERWKPK